MYISLADTRELMKEVGRLSATGSAVFHDAVSAHYVEDGRGPNVAGAKFIGGSDEYGHMWATHAGFTKSYVHNFESVRVDRVRRQVSIDPNAREATSQLCRGRDVVLFVTAGKE